MRDSIIYLTHGVPDEPTFSTAAIVDRVAPVPLVVIHASHDEYVPLPDVTRIVEHAKEPKQLRVVEASSHRFVDALPTFDAQMTDAVTWARQHAPR
jgi:alpha/beta superfamily hydrolase